MYTEWEFQILLNTALCKNISQEMGSFFIIVSLIVFMYLIEKNIY